MNLPSIIILLLGLGIQQNLSYGGCPPKCKCQTDIVSCIGAGLTEIPKNLSQKIIRLDLQENKITKLNKNDFVGLPNLRVLHLMDNEIQLIEPHSFDNLTKLERFRINRNRLRSIPDFLFKYNHKLQRLDLSENALTIITDDQLNGPLSMRNLQLDRNQLTCLDSREISNWKSLEVLELNGNSLNTLGELDYITNLRTLRLADNPWHCDCRLKWMKRSLTPFQLGNAKCHKPLLLHGRSLVNVNEDNMKCSGIEKRAATSCREASVCPSACTCTDTTVDCRDRGLKHIPSNLPLTTTELRLEQNHITYISGKAFSSLKNLKRLDLSKNNIIEIASNAFEGLESLNTLVLYGNNISDIPTTAFKDLKNLQLLLLNSNKLQCLRSGLFDDLINLNLLSLYDNQIQSISNRTFAPLKNLQTLHLAKNPLICDCNLEWLAEKLSNDAIETSGARCEGPKFLERKRLSNLQPSKFKCKGSEYYVTQYADQCKVDYDCPSECLCEGTIIDCSDRGLHEIPSKIPRFSTLLDLSNNNLKEISYDKLKHLINLVKINLNKNEITNIEDGTLDLPALTDVFINDNKLSHFNTAIFGKRTSSILKLSLNGNLLQCISKGTFSKMISIQHLLLGNNKISTIMENSFTNLKDLKHLDLNNNEFNCNCHLLNFVDELNINLTSKLDKPTGAKCFLPINLRSRTVSSVTKHELICNDDNDNICIDSGNYCPIGCECQGTIIRCSGQKYKKFPIGIPLDTTELYFDNNELTNIPVEYLEKLVNLIKIDFSYNNITNIPSKSFKYLTKLSTLILSFNKINCIEGEAFDGLHNLRILSLHGNNISQLPESSFIHLEHLSHIALGNNQLYCDCKMAWFSKWIKSKYVEPGIARCEEPENFKNQLLLTANHHLMHCSSPPPIDIIAKCDYCLKNPCKNGGICNKSKYGTFECQCLMGYHGKYCESVIDACYGDPCLNNGTCSIIQQGRFKCSCPKGFKGERCEENIDDCIHNKCQNGGTCIDEINSYRCICPNIMYSGKYCETKLEYCSSKLNPCENGGKCIKEGDNNYICQCKPGFEGRNCMSNIDDCIKNLCKNGGICIDGINEYTCRCSQYFSGKFCEIPLIENRLYKDSVQCHADSCVNGYCHQNEDGDDFECKCHFNYKGERCEQLRSVSLIDYNSYIALEGWDSTEKGNFTLTINTIEKNGIIAYYGDESYFSLEVYDGRLKVGFYVGNYPPSHMYSYVTINDGESHTITIFIQGNQLQMSIDKMKPQKLSNSGVKNKFIVESKQLFYIGGINKNIGNKAIKKYHLSKGNSLNGCISDVYINGYFMDLEEDVVEKMSVKEGCTTFLDVCKEADCGNGKCTLNKTSTIGYSCDCDLGFSGEKCDTREIQCIKEKYREYYHEDDCRSIEPIKNGRCLGFCGSAIESKGGCCTGVRGRKRRIKMHCKSGKTKMSVVQIIRKCQCVSNCKNPVENFVGTIVKKNKNEKYESAVRRK
ncbi:Slit homolog 2 protein [Strongyloides ratti]|uniref:Slit homolog 2 protein n=1 Tax=Strongyloides ratti TaxID=34506 RepID=A0A090N0Z8_STRRB|nr:Slit homolog 2 protein [Strongyloides ratti]CEF71563.1 Slit homolog 2 protein [Strongyloides ratti]